MALWTKLHASFHNHPKLRLVMRDLGISKAQVAGHLTLLWSWALTGSPDGVISHMSIEEIEILMEWEGEPSMLFNSMVARGLLDENAETITIHDFKENYTAGQACERKRKQRDTSKQNEDVTKCHKKSQNVTKSHIEERRVDKNRREEIIEEILSEATNVTPDSPPIIQIPITKKREYSVTQSDIDEWIEAYPAVDVPQTLRNIRQWNIANPTRVKTGRGIRKHIVGWLSREQDKPRVGRGKIQDYESKEERRLRKTMEVHERLLKEGPPC